MGLCFVIIIVMIIPQHIREEIEELIPFTEFERYQKFAQEYFNELVAIGVFLNDVKFIDLSLKAKRIILFAAVRLWISSRKWQNLV